MPRGIPTIRVRVGPDHASDKATMDRAAVVAQKAPETPLYQADPAFKAAIDDFVNAGSELKEAEIDVAAAQATLRQARSVRNRKRAAARRAQSVCTSQVQMRATTPTDAIACGFLVLDPVSRGLMVPQNILLKYDIALGLLRVHVKYSSGKHKVALEISADAEEPRAWTRIDATAMRQTLRDLAPGIWHLRAATLGSAGRSDWFGPVAVMVR